MNKKYLHIISIAFLLCFFCNKVFSNSKECNIATANIIATKVGCEILANGGNAFDAAVAVTAALSVVEPFSSGLGGGGFYLLYSKNTDKSIFIDAREVAPKNIKVGLYKTKESREKKKSLVGVSSAAIPGIPAAIDYINRTYGNLTLSENLNASIHLAEKGFDVDNRFLRAIDYKSKILNNFENSKKIFSKIDINNRFLIQKDLSNTLRAIASKGRDGFYKGPVANEIIKSVQKQGGIWTLSDLEKYQIILREPIKFKFQGAKIITAPLPSSGGIVMKQVFTILKDFPINFFHTNLGHHYLIETFRHAYNDRAIYLGDSDFVKVPVEKLLSEEYLKTKLKKINENLALSSTELPSVDAELKENNETTHFSILDSFGNKVSATLSVNGAFGSGFVAGSSGVLLNNHIDDFSLYPGLPNLYGLVGNYANAIEPFKRPLSSMTPTFVENEKGHLIIGTPGGSRIITMVILGIIEFLSQDNLNAKAIVSRPRFHHQYKPDVIQIEPEGFSEDWIQKMKKRKHKIIKKNRKWGNMQIILFSKDENKVYVANDPRGLEGILF